MAAGSAASHSTTSATVTNVGPNVLTDVYLQKRFEEANKRKLVAVPLGKTGEIPNYMGKVVRWNRMSLPAALAASAETGPTAVTLTTASVTATLLDFLASYTYTEFLELTGLAGTIPEIVDHAGYQQALTADTICYSSAMTDATQIDAGVSMTAEDLRGAVSTLDGLDAIEHPIAQGVGGKYCVVFSPEQAYDMIGEGAPTWSDAKQETVETALRTPWDGRPITSMVYNCLIKTSTVVTAQSAASEEFGYVVGGAAFGTVNIGPGTPVSPAVYVTTPSERVDRPARDIGAVGSKMYFIAELLNDNNIRELKSDIT